MTGSEEDATESLSSDTPTTTGPTVASWPLDELMREPPVIGPLVWQAPSYPVPGRQPVYYVALTVAVMVVLGLVGGLVVLTVNPPASRVAGSPVDLNLPELPAPTHSTAPGATSSVSPPPPTGEFYGELAAHPLSTATAEMPELTCSLPTFDPTDGGQSSFYEASKVCADGAFGGLLTAAGITSVDVPVVTVVAAAETPCGEVKPEDPARSCAGTVYMTPVRLRDGEANGRYPGRYLGVFLREYALAVLEGAGVGELARKAEEAGASADDVVLRLTQQGTCLAGIASRAMDGRGAVDGNITTEIRERLTDVDSPADAGIWLDKGFQSRQLSACNSWV